MLKRYSLRFLLFVVFPVIVAALAYIAPILRQQSFVTQVSELNGTFLYDYEVSSSNLAHGGTREPPGPAWLRERIGLLWFTRPIHVDLSRCLDVNRALNLVSGLNTIRSVDLIGTQVSDKGISYLRRLPNLRSLSLADASLTADGFNSIAAMQSLESLRLPQCTLDDASLERLSTIRDLRVLVLSGTQVTDRGLAALADCAQLETVILSKCNITDVGISYLAKIPSLRVLTVDGTNVTGSTLDLLENTQLASLSIGACPIHGPAIRKLCQVTSLKALYLNDIELEDDHLAPLASLPSLRYLELRNTSVTGHAFAIERGWSQLSSIDVSGAKVDDAALGVLARLPLVELIANSTNVTGKGFRPARSTYLVKLSMNGTNMDDDGVASLLGLNAIEELALQNTKITDTSLRTIERLTALTFLDVTGCTVSPNGISRLQKRNEELVIMY